MADTRTITIEIVQKENDKQAPVPTPEGQDTTENVEKLAPQKESNHLLRNYIFNQAIQNAKQLTIRSVDASINHYLSLSEDYMAENLYNNAKTLINKISGLGSSIVGGAMTGATVGGVGGAIAGMIIGTGAWTVNEVITYQTRMSGYYRTLNASNIEVDYARRRAGLTNMGRGTEN